MDKETLSNYGWIVICVLVLAVMIALASPFGEFVSSAVKSTTSGLFGVNQEALGAAGIDIADQNFDGANSTLNPDNGTEPQIGDIYTHGNYEYCFGARWCPDCECWSNICGCGLDTDGWAVHCTNNVADPGSILESINGFPIDAIDAIFCDCTALTTAPTIPNSVINMSNAFVRCTSLATAPRIPANVRYFTNVFYGCTSLTGTVEIDAINLDEYYDCFYETIQPIILMGTCPQLESIANEYDNVTAN